MSSKRASLVTSSSLLRLCNGCHSRNVAYYIKGLNTLRTMCSAAEKWDFQFSVGHQTNDSLGYQQNRGGFYQQNAGGSYWNNNASSEQNSYGDGQIAGVGQINSSPKVVHNNLAGHNGSVNGDFSKSDTKMQHNVVADANNSRGFGMHQNAFVEKPNWTQEPRQKVQHPNARNLPGPLEYQGNHKGNLAQNINNYQPSSNDYNTMSNQYSGYGQSHKGNLAQNINSYQPSSNDYNTMSNQYSGYGQTQQCLEYAQYNPKSMVGSNLSINAKPGGESVEASNDNSLRGTLEELDSFCMEGKVKEAVEVLELLEKFHIPVGLSRYLQLMHQCGKAKSLEEAKFVHRHALQHLSSLEVGTYNKILEMYFECGSVDDALKVFNNMQERNLTTWDTMIKKLAKSGLAEDSIDLFTQFKKLGLKPDGQMFIGVFSACSMLGDIDEGMLHFESMTRDFGIIPTMAHFVSVVDMIGTVGHLDEAFEFIEKIPMEPSADVWETLMNLCRVHGNTELGDRCAELVEKLVPFHLDGQSKAGLLPVKISDTIKEKEKKLASKNLLEVRSRVHEYRAGDTSHPENDKIYALLRGMRSQMKEVGYIPETKFVLHDIDQEGKEDALLAHSERLAVAYGLISSPARSPIRIIKNLRVCGDCHTALKIISKLVGRELIIRDAKRFHHFKDGLCSCRDYW